MSKESFVVAIQLLQLTVLLLLLFKIIKSNFVASCRSQEIASFCREKGFKFSKKGSKHLMGINFNILQAFNPATTEFKNCITGTSGIVDFVVADYSYATGHGTSWRNYSPNYGTIWIFTINEGMETPVFYLAKKQVHYSEFDNAFSVRNINLSDVDEEFSKKIIVHGLNEEEIRGFFDEHIFSFFMRLDPENYCCEGCGKSMIFFVPRSLELPERLYLMEKFKKIFVAIHGVQIDESGAI